MCERLVPTWVVLFWEVLETSGGSGLLEPTFEDYTWSLVTSSLSASWLPRCELQHDAFPAMTTETFRTVNQNKFVPLLFLSSFCQVFCHSNKKTNSTSENLHFQTNFQMC
jgi:hypothetical protein